MPTLKSTRLGWKLEGALVRLPAGSSILELYAAGPGPGPAGYLSYTLHALLAMPLLC